MLHPRRMRSFLKPKNTSMVEMFFGFRARVGFTPPSRLVRAELTARGGVGFLPAGAVLLARSSGYLVAEVRDAHHADESHRCSAGEQNAVPDCPLVDNCKPDCDPREDTEEGDIEGVEENPSEFALAHCPCPFNKACVWDALCC